MSSILSKRDEILNLYVQGHTKREIVERTGCNERYVRRTIKSVQSPSAAPPDLATNEPNPDKIWSLFTELQEEQKKINAVPNHLHHAIKTDQPILVTFFSDIHIGNIGSNHKKLIEDIKFLQQQTNWYCVFGGDLIDSFVISKLIGASFHNIANVNLQWYLLDDILTRLEDKIIALGTGNHELWSEELASIDKSRLLAQKHKVLYTKMGGVLTLKVGQVEYVIFRHHRWGAESRINWGNAIKNMYDYGPMPFDIGVLEDKHVPHLEVFQRHGRAVWAIRPGTYKVSDSYSHKQGYYGADTKNPTVWLHPKEKHIVGFPDMYDAVKVMRNV